MEYVRISLIVKLINSLNKELTNDNEIEDIHPLQLNSNGDNHYIDYFGHWVWSSWDDERKWLDEQTREPLEAYLKREINKMNSKIRTVTWNNL
jgi:hypothetical protein